MKTCSTYFSNPRPALGFDTFARVISVIVLGSIATQSQAQSSVNLQGVLGIGVASLSGASQGRSTFNPSRVYVMAQDSKVPTRIVFKGTEDLGGGMQAIFLLDRGLNLDDGTDTLGGAARETFVGLKTNYGALTFGRQFHPLFNVRDNFDPTADSSNVMATAAFRMNNSVMYRTPTINGFYAKGAVGLGEVSGNNKAGRQTGAHFGYDRGPFSTLIGYNTLYDGTGSAHATNSLWSGSYDFGMIAGFVEVGINKGFVANGVYSTVNSNDLLLGTRVPYGANMWAFTWIRKNDKTVANADAHQLQMLYTYRLSKRTLLYGVATSITNSGNSAYTTAHAPTAPTAAQLAAGARPFTREFSVGIRHNF